MIRSHDPAPRGLRTLASVAMVTASVFALACLPRQDLPIPWLLAFTLPGATLGGWSRITRSPWRRALVAVAMQASACWAALALVGPVTRPAALACTILPPLAFATARSHDDDPSLALFLSLCVVCVGTIIDGLRFSLLSGYVVAAFLTLHTSTLRRSYRSCAPPNHIPTLRAADLSAGLALTAGCALAVFAVERTLSCLPSLSHDVAGRQDGDDANNQLKVGLNDTFSFKGEGGVLAGLRGEQLVRAESADGRTPGQMYLRCGFFTVPGLDRWGIGPLELQPQSEPDGHVFRRANRRAAVETLRLQRYAGAAKFVFLPPHATQIRGLQRLTVDPLREWVRPLNPDASPYAVTWQDHPPIQTGAAVDQRARHFDLVALPADLDLAPYRRLLDAWGVSQDATQAMAAIAAGLEEHCSYERRSPSGPFNHELENFLFADADRHGYCMHFASAAALMLRMRGIPCRIGVGLYGGRPSIEGSGARVYGSQHAHAWVEVPFKSRGFTVFDPTPPGARGRERAPDDPANTAAAPAQDSEQTGYARAIRALSEAAAAPWVWSLALGATLLLAMTPRRAPRRPTLTHARVTTRARRKLQKLMRALAHAGHHRSRGQTLEGFAEELHRRERLIPDVEAAFLAYQEVRFGGRDYDDQRAQTMEQGVRAATAMQTDAER